MKNKTLTKEINSQLKIKSVKGFNFGNNKIQFTATGGLGLYHPTLGFVSFSKDKYGISVPYTPRGGRKALKEILDNGGLIKNNTIEFAKPL